MISPIEFSVPNEINRSICTWTEDKWDEVSKPQAVKFKSFGETTLVTIECINGDMHYMHIHQRIDGIIRDIVCNVLAHNIGEGVIL